MGGSSSILSPKNLLIGAGLIGLGAATGGFGLLGGGAAAGAAGAGAAAGGTAAAGGAATGAAAGGAAAGAGAGAAAAGAATNTLISTAATGATDLAAKEAVGVAAKTAATETAKAAATETLHGTAATGATDLVAEKAREKLYSRLVLGLGAAGTAAQIHSNNVMASQQNNMLKYQEYVDGVNAEMDKAEDELNMARKEKEIQQNLARTLATQSNLYAANGVSVAPNTSAANVMNNTVKAANDDLGLLRNMKRYNDSVFRSSAFNRQAAYYAARKNNKASAGASSLGSLVNFGLATLR